jgi:hypothetical protein
MQHTTYREELEKMSVVIVDGYTNNISNYLVIMFDLMKKIATKFNRVKGYVGYMASGKNPHLAIDVMTTLLNIMTDNQFSITKEHESDYELLIKYMQLITNNLDEYIQDNPNIIYDEEETMDPLMKTDMLGEAFRLISQFCGTFAT